MANLCRTCTLLTVTGALMLASTPAAMQNSSSFQRANRQEPSLTSVIERAVVYVESFERDFAAVVAEEQLEQRASNSGLPDTVRRTRSDLLLIRVPGREEWLPFRDVFEVNGRAVRDRDERLQKLFVDGPASALTDAARITNESSRYNIGTVIRTINVPTFALMLLRPANVKRFQFRKRGEEMIGDVMAWRVDFVERRTPTIVRTLRGANVPLEGSLWIDPASGRVVKTLVKSVGTPDPGAPMPPPGSGHTLMWVVVTYTPSETLGLWVPEKMSEWARAADMAVVSGTATYLNFRRFEVNSRIVE